MRAAIATTRRWDDFFIWTAYVTIPTTYVTIPTTGMTPRTCDEAEQQDMDRRTVRDLSNCADLQNSGIAFGDDFGLLGRRLERRLP
jgi:hypothetical protein